MRVGVLSSGGKDSMYAAWLAKKQGNKIECLISVFPENKESYMFHTPSIEKTLVQARIMETPIVTQKTSGIKEEELKDLEKAIKAAISKYKIEGVVTGTVNSVYQSERIQKICNKLGLECLNPLWQKDQLELLRDLIKNKFRPIITGVFAYPLDRMWLGRKIDAQFIEDIKCLADKYKINPAGEGGEYETFVLDCPLFKRALKVKTFKDYSSGDHSWRRELDVE